MKEKQETEESLKVVIYLKAYWLHFKKSIKRKLHY